MTSDSPSGGARSAYQAPSLRGVVLAHKRVAALVIGLVLFVIGLVVGPAVVGSSQPAAALTDASTCSQWSAAGAAQQRAFVRLYITEHGGAGFLSPAALTATIQKDCVTAAYLGESEDMSIVGALTHAF